MVAAKTNAEEAAVDLLLSKQANPDAIVVVNNGEEYEEYTALTYAIESENHQLVTKLMKVTNVGLKVSFSKLADSAFNNTSIPVRV